MKLSELYTTGTVAKRNNDGSTVAYVCTKKLSELYPDLNMEFDTTILLNNGSTSELLNTGAFGQTATAYNKSNTLYHGEPSSKIQYLGCCVVREWGFGTFINLSKHLISGSSWDSNFKLRFVINIISNENIGYNDYQPFNIDDSTNVVYDFNSTYVVCNFGYKKTNTTRDISGYVQNPHELDGTGTDGDTGKRICYDEYSVMATAYNKYLADTANISKSNIGELAFVYLINGDYFLVRKPLYVPDSGYQHVGVTIDSNKYYLTIGGFADFDDGISGFLPTNDETKGAIAFRNTSSGQYVNCTNYFVTSNCAEYVLNSCGLRWVTTESISKAKDFRDNVRLGVMDKNGIINHKEWITGESGIQASDNPNKDTSYDNIPDRPTPGGGDDDIDDIALTMSTVNNAAFRKLFALNATELNQLEAALSGNYLEPLPSGFDPLQSVISLSVFPWDITNVNWIGCNTAANAQITISGWDSGVTGSYVTGATSAFIELDSFNVEHRHNNFLDYAPYTTVSVYVPYCGEIELPTNLVMGQSVRVFLIYDIPSGSCRAVIKSSNGAILGTIAGNFSSEIEITSSEAGLKKQSIINTALNTTGQVVSAAIGVVKEDISAATGGIVGSLGAVSQSIASMNKNYTSSVGATDGMVNFFMPDQCYIKITRPRVSIPSNYGHTTGYACNKTMKLGDLIPGNYYVANNPDLSDSLGNEEEKTMLKAALENGFFK